MSIERTCIVTRAKYDKKLLVRIVKINDGSICIDKNHSIKGRGAYIYPNVDNISIVRKKKLLNRALKCMVSDLVYDELEVYINGELS